MLSWIDTITHGWAIKSPCRNDRNTSPPVTPFSSHGEGFVAAKVGSRGCTEYTPILHIQKDNQRNEAGYGFQQSYVWTGRPLLAGLYHVRPHLRFDGEVHLFSLPTHNNNFTDASAREAYANCGIVATVIVQLDGTGIASNSKTVLSRRLTPTGYKIYEFDGYYQFLERVYFRYDGVSDIQIHVSIEFVAASKGAGNRAHFQAIEDDSRPFRVRTEGVDLYPDFYTQLL